MRETISFATDNNVGTKKMIYTEDAVDAVKNELDAIDHVPQWVFDRLEKALDAVESAQPEPSWDCEKCIMEHTDEMEKLEAELAIAKSKHPEPCEDAVNRETLLKFFDGWMSVLDENCHNQSVSDLKIIKRDFANLPPVTPKQPEGEWEPVGMAEAVGGESAQWGTAIAYHRCNKCHEQALQLDGDEVLSDFCPHCGVKMKPYQKEE